MPEILLIGLFVLILLVAGVILALGLRKGNKAQRELEITSEMKKFETQYDELTHLYKSGSISEREYKSRIKKLIN